MIHSAEKRALRANGISLIVSDWGEGFDARTIPDPLAVENLEPDHGRGIHIMKLAVTDRILIF